MFTRGSLMRLERLDLTKRDVASSVLELQRLVVDPTRLRAGIGTALVRAALAAEPEARRAIVQTGASNEPEKRLYRREGFVEIGDVEVLPGLWVTRFDKLLDDVERP